MTAMPHYVVACDDYTSDPFRSREAAERRIEEIERAGHCTNIHRIEEEPCPTSR